MKHDDAFTDALLSEALGYADPSEQDIARNLANVEQRLGIAGGGDAGAERQSAGSRRTGRQGVRSISQPARAVRSGTTSATAVGRWIAISAVGALIGYLGGRAESQREITQLERQTHEQAQLLERQETRLQETRLQETRLQETRLQETEREIQQAARQQASAEKAQQTPQREPELHEESSEPAQTPGELHALGRQPQKPVAPTRVPHATRTARAPRLLREAQPSAASAAPRANQELRRAIELLQRAEAQLRAGDAFAASLLLSDLDRSVPPELLREERLVTRALVGCALGEVASARAALHELDQLDAQSIYRARLEGSCAEKKRD